jgi:membrane fusion protein, multidrug efflux system
MSDETRPSTQAPAESPTPAAGQPAAAPRRRRSVLRPVLLTLGPLLVVGVGAYFYMTGGRYVSTDNAYVKSDLVLISAEVSGPITSVAVHENQRVARGDVLFTIDDRSFQIAYSRAKAQLRAIHDYVESQRASYLQTLEELAQARTDAAYEKHEFERLSALAAKKLASEIDVDAARHKTENTAQEVTVKERSLDSIRARLGGDPDRPLDEQAMYTAAKTMLDSAELNLEHTVVRVPFDGIASKVPMIGHYVTPGAAVMSIVADSGAWIEANYKETDLTYVAVGQSVDIQLDTYPDHHWQGRVQSISQATGAEFSVIPAQNATGNWVKVIQRIPVRIAIDTHPNDPQLRAGMSAVVDIDTKHRRGRPGFLSWLGGGRPAAPGQGGGEIATASAARGR